MSNFTLKREGFLGHTSIPNIFIEKYMPKAAGEFVKIYIYLLKCLSENKGELSISRIADAFDDTHKDVIRAFKYWQRNGWLKLTFDGDTLTSLSLISPPEELDAAKEAGLTNDSVSENITLSVSDHIPPSAAKSRRQASQKKPEPEEVEKPEYSRDEIAAFSAGGETPLLIFGIQKYLGRTLSSSDLNSVMFFKEGLGFSDDLIEYLFEYCVSNRHKNMRYIEKTAMAWAEEGIRSVAAAKVKCSIYNSSSYPVMNVFGLSGRKPSKTETGYIDKWILSYGFEMDIILEACKRTIDTTHQPSFEYADSILKRWKAAGATSMDKIALLDEQHAKLSSRKKEAPASKDSRKAANKFNDFEQRKYNYDELEKKIFNK